MADVYTQFSAILKLTDADQIKWSSHLLAVLGKIHDLSDYGEAPVVTLEVLATAGNDPDIDLAKEMLSLYEKNFKPFCSDQLPAEMQEQVDEDQGLWFHADENGNVDFAATIVHVILKKFNLDTVFTIEWAETCSRPIVGSFGGGACVVTRKDILWLNSATAAANLEKIAKANMKKSAKKTKKKKVPTK